MNGGPALFLRSLVVTDATVHVALFRSASTAFDSASLPILMFAPSRLEQLGVELGGTGPASRAVMFQYSSGDERLDLALAIATSFSATDCTRPALRPRRTLSQRIGLIL